MTFPSWLQSSKEAEWGKKDPYLEIIAKFSEMEEPGEEVVVVDKLFRNKLGNRAVNLLNKFIVNDQLNKEEFLIATIESGVEINKITQYLSWQNFEYLTASILSKSHWKTTTNFRFFGEGPADRNRKRFEIDIIAWKRPHVLIIDCKRYTTPNTSIIKASVNLQIERVYELFEMIPVIHELPEMKWVKWNNALLIPMIVTWKDHRIKFHEQVPICPSSKLLDFLSSFDQYFDKDEFFNLRWEL